jgi:hypothetical protein
MAAEFTGGDREAHTRFPNLESVVQQRTWPTPHGICQPGPRRPGPSGNELGRAVNEAEQWPTPTRGDADRGGGRSAHKSNPGSNLRTQVGGSLNPTWVEWLMGFPLGWTDCGA